MSHPKEFFLFQNGILSAQGVSLSQIADEVGTPAYVYSSEAFLSPIHLLQKELHDLDHLICFAVKSNSNLAILRLLKDAGAGVDLVSGGELFRAGRAGFPSKKVVFSGVGKTREEIEMALSYQDSGIYSFHIESIPELMEINSVATKRGLIANIALRFNPDVDAKTHPYISTGLKKNKFGLNRKEVLQLIGSLSEFKAVRLHGISIHIGSQLLSLSPLKNAFEKLDHLLLEISPLLPTPLEFVDLGGGIGITYKNEKTPPLDRYAKLIQQFFGKKSRHRGRLKILLEPGRLISGNSGLLLTRVLYRKKRANKDFIIIDAGMNDLVRPALYQSYHEIVPIQESLLRKNLSKTSIVGPVCESSDCFGDNRLLSQMIQKDEILAILSAGAYGFSMASQYNSRPKPPEILIHQGSYQVVRKRETYEDLVRGEF